MEIYDNIIIGSGPAGYTAAIYLGRSGVKPLIIEGFQPGGQLTTTTEVENFPGFPDGIDANDLMERMRTQAIKYGAEILPQEVVKTNLATLPYSITLDDGRTLQAKTLIIATGASAKYLGLADEDKYKGQGVSACATCDGFFYRKKVVAVVGGGDTACEEATYLAGLAKQVYMIVRKPYLRASKAMQERVAATDNIKILYQTNAIGLSGDNGVETVTLKTTAPQNMPDSATEQTPIPPTTKSVLNNPASVSHNIGSDLGKTNKDSNNTVSASGKTTNNEDKNHAAPTKNERIFSLPIDGFFLAIGHTPNSGAFRPWVETDEQGYILTAAPSTATNKEGIFAAGDVADAHYQQAVNAAASGCRAAIDAFAYLKATK